VTSVKPPAGLASAHSRASNSSDTSAAMPPAYFPGLARRGAWCVCG
jgi:uncharacterized protein (DUF2237 family)